MAVEEDITDVVAVVVEGITSVVAVVLEAVTEVELWWWRTLQRW
jgi:hypothetical protein